MSAKLTEADVLFGIFLPLLCEQQAAALELFKGRIEFQMTGPTPRVWRLTGGNKPWVRGGEFEDDDADLRVTLSEGLVKAVVQGRDPDLDAAFGRGEIKAEGNLKILAAFDLAMAEPRHWSELLKKNGKK